MSKSFRLKSKGFFLTYPQCPAPKQVVADMLATKAPIVKGLIGQEHHMDGNLHLHAYVKFEKDINTVNPAFFDIEFEGKSYHGNYQTAKSAIASIKYISKEDKEPLELGDMDYTQEMDAKTAKKKVLGKRLANGESVADLVAQGATELMFGYNKLVADQKAYLNDCVPKPQRLEEPCGVWVYGPPGVGKSYYCRELCGIVEDHILNKNLNKWLDKWDPHTHKAMLLDDFGPSNACLGGYLKTWADIYPFPAEVKGGTLQNIRPEKVFVTSNYTIEEIWKEDPHLVEALQDRFQLVDARDWEKRRSNANQDIWKSLNEEKKAKENWEQFKQKPQLKEKCITGIVQELNNYVQKVMNPNK